VEDSNSGDLFWCSRGNGMYRRNGITGAITQYSPDCGDGICFDAAKNILYASGNSVCSVPGPTTAGLTLPVSHTQCFGAGGCSTDGIAVSTDNKYIYANCNNGGQVVQITRANGTVKTILTDDYRGDFMIVGPDDCIYFTHEYDSIWQLCPKSGCNITLQPTPQGCNPLPPCGAPKNCGTISDGCHGTSTCAGPACNLPYSCGGGGTANVCGCTPTPVPGGPSITLTAAPNQTVEDTLVVFTATLSSATAGSTNLANFAVVQQGNLNVACSSTLSSAHASFVGSSWTCTVNSTLIKGATTQGSHKYLGSFLNGSPPCVAPTYSPPIVVNVTEIPHKNAGGV